MTEIANGIIFFGEAAIISGIAALVLGLVYLAVFLYAIRNED